MSVDDSRCSRAAVRQFVPTAQPALLDDFDRRLHPEDLDELCEAEPPNLLAKAVDLEHYDWLAYDSMARDFRDSPDEHTDVTEVS